MPRITRPLCQPRSGTRRNVGAMTTVLLVRHGRTAANADRCPRGLDTWGPPRRHRPGAGGRAGRAAAARPAGGGGHQPARAHPRDRRGDPARARAGPGAGGRRPAGGVPLRRLDRPRLKALAKEPLWRVVQAHPSAAVFPGEEGEGMAAMQRARWPPSAPGTRRWATTRPLYAVVSARRRHQGDARGRPGPAPRLVPAAPGRPVLGVRRALHPPAPVRPADQRRRRRRRLVRRAGEEDGRRVRAGLRRRRGGRGRA